MAGGKKPSSATTRQRRSTTADTATLEDKCHPRKIFVGGLASDTTTHDLRDYFGQFGDIVDAVVLRWPDGRSRGFGYVTFADAHAPSALPTGTHTVGGQEVDVKRAVPGTNKLFVGGLPQSTMAAELREHFEAFGVVSDAVVMIDPATGRSRGFGFVCFAPGQSGAAAVTAALDQYKSHRIRGKWIEVKSAAPPHRFVSHEAEGASTPPTSSPARTPPCTTPPAHHARPRPALGAQGCDDTPLPQLLVHAGWAEPQKVLLPPSVVAAIGTPPGLDRAVQGTALCGGAALGLPGGGAARAHRGAISAIPRPGAISAATAAQQSLWWSSAAAPAKPPGRFGGAAPGAGPLERPVACAGGDFGGGALQRSLEELLRLKMHGPGCPGVPEQPAVA